MCTRELEELEESTTRRDLVGASETEPASRRPEFGEACPRREDGALDSDLVDRDCD